MDNADCKSSIDPLVSFMDVSTSLALEAKLPYSSTDIPNASAFASNSSVDIPKVLARSSNASSVKSAACAVLFVASALSFIESVASDNDVLLFS